jgi:hypothetical protein
VADPAAAAGTDSEKRLAFAQAFAVLDRRISLFASLNPLSLERLALEQKVRDIGRIIGDDEMKKLEIYEPALCCSTGVCGVDVDQQLVNFAADVAWAKQNGARIERFNLAQQPMAFAENPVVKGFLEHSGQEALPLMLMDGEIMLAGRYPNRAELARWAEIAPPATEAISAGGCCSGSRCG